MKNYIVGITEHDCREYGPRQNDVDYKHIVINHTLVRGIHLSREKVIYTDRAKQQLDWFQHFRDSF